MTSHVSHFSFILIVRWETKGPHDVVHLHESYSYGSGAAADILNFSNIAKEDRSATVSKRPSKMMSFNAAVCY